MNYNGNVANTSSSSSLAEQGRKTIDFLNSESYLAKVAYVLIVILFFIIILRVGVSAIGYLFKYPKKTELISGMVDATHLVVIPQDPSIAGAKPILRSVNEDAGIEFTWSVWILIDNLTYNTGKYKCVFYKGNDYLSQTSEANGLNFPNNAPGVYIDPNKNALAIFMNTYRVINEEIYIDNIPLNKWVNVVIRCKNETLDVYINGTIAKSHKLHGVPKQNYGDVYVAMNGGFAGNISSLNYYNYAVGLRELQAIASKGPNTKLEAGDGDGSSSTASRNSANYLSLRWFF